MENIENEEKAPRSARALINAVYIILTLWFAILFIVPSPVKSVSNPGTSTTSAMQKPSLGAVGYTIHISGGSSTCIITGAGSDVYGGIQIPTHLQGYKVTEIGSEAFMERNDITSVSVPSTVSLIGSCAFAENESLTEVTIEYGTSQIGERAFYGCKRLVKVTLPSSISKIGADAFRGCDALTEVVFRGTRDEWVKLAGWNDLHGVHCTVYCADGVVKY